MLIHVFLASSFLFFLFLLIMKLVMRLYKNYNTYTIHVKVESCIVTVTLRTLCRHHTHNTDNTNQNEIRESYNLCLTVCVGIFLPFVKKKNIKFSWTRYFFYLLLNNYKRKSSLLDIMSDY